MINTNEHNNNNESSKTENPKHFITDENFNAIIKIQNEIYEATEVKLTLRKIINQVITTEALEHVKAKMIKNINACF